MAMKTKSKKVPKKTTRTMGKTPTKVAKIKVARKTKAASERYNRQSDQPTAAELQALQRLDPLTKTYQTAGMSAQEARQRALRELNIPEPNE
jgi:hypothetical protein